MAVPVSGGVEETGNTAPVQFGPPTLFWRRRLDVAPVRLSTVGRRALMMMMMMMMMMIKIGLSQKFAMNESDSATINDKICPVIKYFASASGELPPKDSPPGFCFIA